MNDQNQSLPAAFIDYVVSVIDRHPSPLLNRDTVETLQEDPAQLLVWVESNLTTWVTYYHTLHPDEPELVVEDSIVTAPVLLNQLRKHYTAASVA